MSNFALACWGWIWGGVAAEGSDCASGSLVGQCSQAQELALLCAGREDLGIGPLPITWGVLASTHISFHTESCRHSRIITLYFS